MDKLEKSDFVNGKPVRVVLIFDDYKENNYKKDFEDFVKYQKKLSLTGESGEVEFRFLKGADFSYIPFNTFKEMSVLLFSQTIFFMLKSNPHFIYSDELNIQIKIRRLRGYHFETLDDLSTPEDACYDGWGYWFLQTIVGPYYYTKQFDYSIVARYFLHELTHYTDQMNKYLAWDARYSDKIKQVARKKSAYCLNYVYNCLFNLREEGFADFVARAGNNKFDINMNGVREFNRNLLNLILITKKHNAEQFYEKHIGWENITPSGEYTNGRNICLFIALSLAKQRKLAYTMHINNKTMVGFDFDLDKILSSNHLIYVSNLNHEILSEAKSIIQPAIHYKFLQVYESACKNLGLSEKNMIMTQRRFYNLVLQAIEHAKSERRKKLTHKGFEFVDSKYE